MGATTSTLAHSEPPTPTSPTSPTSKHAKHSSLSQIYPDFQHHLNALQSNGFSKAISRRKSHRVSGSSHSTSSNSSGEAPLASPSSLSSGSHPPPTSSGTSNTSTVLSSHPEEEESVEEFRFLYGRKYHNHPSSRYVLPCDSEEIDRLHLQHYVLKLALQKNLHVPLPSTGCVLDVGCGGATWTMDMATEMPDATFYGIDIAPVYPTAIHPRNCHFSKQDISEGTNFDSNMFDVVFQRNLSFGLTQPQWESAIQEARRLIKPGGYFESTESDCLIHSAGPQTARVMQVLRHMLRSRGVDPDVIHSLPAMLTKAGFEEVTLKQYNIPLGPRGGRTGQLWQQNVFAVLDICRRRLARYANLNEEQVGEIVAEMQREATEDFDSYMTIYVTYARKPLV
ncbi:hypothetical protein BGW41_000005 [Actinomortierella wolfii]|nr:hypothetical protein BGW41_000005 [Actinomortierella wolfii]